ncbi:MFS transporter [Haladaptatus sp. NG-WS-4]
MSVSTETPVPSKLEIAPFVAVMSVGYVLFAPAAIPDVLTGRFHVGYTEFGLVTSVPLLSFVLAQAPSSYLTTRYSTTRILLGVTLIHLMLAVTLDFAHTFLTLLALRAVWGLAGGVVLTAGATHIVRLHQGSSATSEQGFYGGALTFGGVVAFLAVPVLLENMGRFGLHTPGTLVGVLAAVACWRHRDESITHPDRSQSTTEPDESTTVANPTERAANPNERHRTVRSTKRKRMANRTSKDLLSNVRYVLSHPVVVVAAVCYVATMGSYVALSTFITAYFDALDVAGPLNAAVLLVATTGRAVGGVVTDRWEVHDWTVIAVATAMAILGFAVLALARSPTVLLIFPLLAMLAISFPFGAIYGVAGDTTVDAGIALAIVIAAGNLAALLLPAVTGIIRDMTGSYRDAFLLLGALNAIAAITVIGLRAKHDVHSSIDRSQ